MRRQKNRPEAAADYDYSDRESRERTVQELFARAKNARTARELEWTRYNDYYNGIHDATSEIIAYCRENDLPWTPANMPDPWILVESQMDPTVPEPEFRGRDADLDSEKAREREFAVRYIAENNRLKDMNTRNERRLLKLGDAFWKAYWDPAMRCGVREGDIRLKDIPVDAIFPDPSVRDGTIQDGQYLCYVYRIHKVLFGQMFCRELAELGISQEDLLSRDYVERAGLFDLSTAVDDTDDTIQVLEHWFRQPTDTRGLHGEPVRAGAVGCSIQAGGRELRYIPNYWERTGEQNKLFPFVHYWRIQDENQIWNKSELFPILDLVDAADRKLAMGLLNDAFMANDILLVEEGALADGAEVTNEPGAVLKLRPNAMGRVQRLGGLQSIGGAAQGVDFFKEQIERTARNYETAQGKEASMVTSATGLALLRSDAQTQAEIKRQDRNAGFERLYELLDWLALEFFDDDRMLFLGADPSRGRPARSMRFNADDLSEERQEGRRYWPRIDVTVTASDSVIRSKAATCQALQALSSSNVTAENWRLFAAQLEVLDIPGKQEIIDDWRRRFEMPRM
ncbi:MAG: hypothetical protein IKQ69_06980 [Oscillospiraceae bacterium]|nr:hypothetical protein [Oscillospiraceae bacterium]